MDEEDLIPKIDPRNKRKSLKQKEIDMENYIENFQNLCLSSRVQEDDPIKVVSSLGGLKWSIQEELSQWTPIVVHKLIQLGLKVEEEKKKKEDSNFRGRGKAYMVEVKEDMVEEDKILGPKETTILLRKRKPIQENL